MAANRDRQGARVSLVFRYVGECSRQLGRVKDGLVPSSGHCRSHSSFAGRWRRAKKARTFSPISPSLLFPLENMRGRSCPIYGWRRKFAPSPRRPSSPRTLDVSQAGLYFAW